MYGPINLVLKVMIVNIRVLITMRQYARTSKASSISHPSSFSCFVLYFIRISCQFTFHLRYNTCSVFDVPCSSRIHSVFGLSCYSTYLFQASAYAKAYLALGLRKGDRIIISGLDDDQYGGMVIGAFLIGLVVTTVSIPSIQ